MSDNQLNINDSYIIFSGLFRFNANNIDKKRLFSSYTSWKHRVFDGNYKATFGFLRQCYYDTYLINSFPEIVNDNAETIFNKHTLNHYTHKDYLEKSKNHSYKINCLNGKEYDFKIDFADIYLFPYNIGIISFKCILNNNYNCDDISNFIYNCRFLDAKITEKNSNISLTIEDLISKTFLKNVNPLSDWVEFNPQLKSYTNIDINTKLPTNELDALLYEIGNTAPIGSSQGGFDLSPSTDYYKKLLSTSKISVFNNWTALVLFDTFTRISTNYPDKYNTWEYDFFNIYIHCLFMKFFLYHINNRMCNNKKGIKETLSTKQEFADFTNNYYYSHISYKFLPNHLRDQLIEALDINYEIERMEVKIRRINEQADEKRENTTNLILIVIGLLSVFCMIYDTSCWLVDMGISDKFVFPSLSLVMSLVIIISIIGLLVFKNKQK